MAAGDITRARLVLDVSCDKGQRDKNVVVEAWRTKFGDDSVRICRNHAKIARITNGSLKVLVRGSCNLNFNPRFENVDVSEGGPEFDLVKQIEDELPCLGRDYRYKDAMRASKVDQAFEQSTLAMFELCQVWAK